MLVRWCQYNTVQHLTRLISFLTAAVVVKSSDEAVILVFNGCDEAVVKYFCVVTVFVSVRALVC